MNKIKLISTISLGAMLLSTVSFAKTGTVNVDEVVVRDGASTSTGIVAGIKQNSEVEILGEENGFYKIKYNDINGYVRSDLLTVKEEEQTSSEQQEDSNPEKLAEEAQEETPSDDLVVESNDIQVEFPKEFTLTTSVNVSIMPTYSSKVISSLESGKNVTINKQVGSWSYISCENIIGWVRNYNLENSVEVPNENETIDENNNNEQPADIQVGYVNVSSVNVREKETTDSKVVTVLSRNTEVKVVSSVGNWYKIQYGDFTGFIMQEYISDSKEEVTSRSEDAREPVAIETKTGYISVQLANVRKKASTSSKVIKTLKQKSEVQVAGAEGDFSKIILDDGTEAFVASNLIVYSLDEISVLQQEQPQTTSNNSSNSTQVYTSTGSSSGEGIVEFAKQFLYKPYVYGGTTPEDGFDCSGFIYYVFNSCGINLSRSCTTQAVSGTPVNKEDLQLGDVIFFNNTSSGAIGHVGIYIGNGEFIHAANPSRGVTTDTVNSGYYCTYYYSARRIAN